MGELLKTDLTNYIFIAVFFLAWSVMFVIGIFKKTKSTDKKVLKILLRMGVSLLLLVLFVWHFICANLFPISVAYYEYTNKLTEETVGYIKYLEQRGKDRIYITINDEEYIVAHSSADPVFEVGKDFDRGDTVQIVYGTNSKFVFDIYVQEEP